MEYLRAWRMAVAKNLLHRHSCGIAEVRFGKHLQYRVQPARGPITESLRTRALARRVKRDFARSNVCFGSLCKVLDYGK